LAPIDWVGMASIELPILFKQEDGVYRIPAKAEAKVSLDKKHRVVFTCRVYTWPRNRI